MRHRRRTSWRGTAKSISIKAGRCRSDSESWKVSGAYLRRSARRSGKPKLRGPRGDLTTGQKSAEGKVAKKAGESRKERRPERWERQVGLDSHERQAAE